MNTKKLVLTAMFVGLIVLLGLTPIGMIPLGFVYISILAIPVVIGTHLLGLKTGMVLGASFALVSALKAYGILGAPSSLVAPILAGAPALVAVMCFVPRLLIPLTTYLTGKLFHEKKLGLVVSSVVGSLTNTVFYLGLMLLFYVLLGLDATAVLALIAGTGLIGGGLEAVANALISPTIILALQKLNKTEPRKDK